MRDSPIDGAHPCVAPHQVKAFNLSRHSENKIHDDTIARQLGFTGSLVPGVEVYAYACHPIVEAWGRDWLAHGRARCRFIKPVYDGHLVHVKAAETQPDTLTLNVESDGVLCATIVAERGDPAPLPDIDRFVARDIPVERPIADEISLAPGTWLGKPSLEATPAVCESYRQAVSETDDLYGDAGLVHPGQILRLCNQALIRNVILDVWIHTGSVIQNFDTARIGETLSVRAQVVGNYDHRGHRIVELDILVLANTIRPIARVLHKAIYRLREGERPT